MGLTNVVVVVFVVVVIVNKYTMMCQWNTTNLYYVY